MILECLGTLRYRVSVSFWSAVIVPVLLFLTLLALLSGGARAQSIVSQGEIGPNATQGTAFTYQGRLIDTGHSANGTYDFEFKLFDASDAGNLVGTQPKENVDVTDGLFTIVLDFGTGAFTGDARYLEISVRPGYSTGNYTRLAPRQALTATPYTLYAGAAPWSRLVNLPDGFRDGSDDTDDTVSWSEISGIVGNESDQVARGDHAHAGYYTRDELRGDGSAGVHWGNLITVPAGLEDGDDDTLAELACDEGQVPKWNGGSWICDEDSTGSAGDTTTVAAGTSTDYWTLRGNRETILEFDFLGTIDNQPLEIRVSFTRALRLEPTGSSPNIIGGHISNTVSSGVEGATISGGGSGVFVPENTSTPTPEPAPNQVTGSYATVRGGRGNTASQWYVVIGGGVNNTAGGNYATVSGGEANMASGDYATVGGGSSNKTEPQTEPADGRTVSDYATIAGGGPSDTSSDTGNRVTDDYGTIRGGGDNQAGDESGTVINARYPTVGGGKGNTAGGNGGEYATVGGGEDSKAAGAGATVGGGQENTTSKDYATIGGGRTNEASGEYATVGGGRENSASGDYATIGGGYSNAAEAITTTVGGGQDNTASEDYATIGGGRTNEASGEYATVGGGQDNVAGENHATIGGGRSNEANGEHATAFGGEMNSAVQAGASVVGGRNNAAGGESAGDTFATVIGGQDNAANTQYATVGGGRGNTAGSELLSDPSATVGGGRGNTAGNSYAAVPGGQDNTAVGEYSFAAGHQAQALHRGTFVWADDGRRGFASTSENQFIVRATGGVRFVTGITTGTASVRLAPGSGAWSSLSDRSAKTNFVSLGARNVLTRLASLPINTWNYKTQDPVVRHIGPVAQDFYVTFNLGEDGRYISSVDADGVALAATQGLHGPVRENEGEIAAQQSEGAALRAENEVQQQQIETLEARVAALERAIDTAGPPADAKHAAFKPKTGTGRPTGWLVLGGLILISLALGWRSRAGGES